MLRRLIRQFAAGGHSGGRRSGGRRRRGSTSGSTGARIGAAVERFVRGRR